jgi:pSer/pThr/pTyr-binding forkhead associated (FHA) protein
MVPGSPTSLELFRRNGVGGPTVDRGVRAEMKVQLVVIRGKPAGKTVEFSHGEYYFGRGKECHIRSNNEWIGRQHCLLRITPTGAYLRDLGSCNGTLVNGTLLSEELALQSGDHVQLGPLVFEVRLVDGPQARRGDTSSLTATDVDTAESPDPTAGTDAGRISTETYPAFRPPDSEQKKS